MPDWLQITLAIGSPVLTIIGTAFVVGSRSATIETNVSTAMRAIESLTETTQRALDGKMSVEQGRGLQAQIKRLEHADAACDGKIGAVRDEFDGRAERINAKLENSEKNRAAASEAAAGHFGKLEAMMGAMKEQLDRLERERVLTPPQAPQQPDLIALLNALSQARPLLAQLAGSAH